MANTPNIRFKGFTDDWEQRKLGELSSSLEYGLNVASKEFDGKNKYIRITDIDDSSHEFLMDGITSPDIDLSTVDDYKLFSGDILFARTGASVGKSYIYRDSDGLVYFAGFLIRARIKKEYNPEFIFQNTLTTNYEKYITITSQRSGQPGINAQEYSDYKIMIPERDEQNKISTYLRNIDYLIILHQHKCDEVRQLKKFMLQKMFPKSCELIPEIRFAGFTDDWEQCKLSTIITEKLSNGVINKPGTEDSNVKHINVINMYTPDKIHTEDLASSLYDENTIQKCNVEVGDIFMTRSSLKPEGIAEANVLLDSGRYVFDDHLIRMKVDKSKYDPMFVKINLGNRMIKTQFIMKSKTTAFTTIGQEDILECKGMFPCLEEQKKIGDYFQNIDHLITLHQRKCYELKEVKSFMLQNMFPQKG